MTGTLLDEEPHDKPYMTTRLGRIVDRVTYGDIVAFAGVVLAFSTLYFWIATPFCLGIVDSNKANAGGLGNALYFSIVTFTSLGYGDLAPQSLGRVVAAGAVLSGLVLVALLVGKVASERQFSLLLLLHTSDCQRRLSAFGAQLNAGAVAVSQACASGQRKQLRDSVFELEERFSALKQYAIFNAHQARMAAFGNESTLRGLFVEMHEAQLACTAAFQSPVADERIGTRALRVVNGLADLARRLVQFRERAEQDRLSIRHDLLRKLRSRLLASRRVPRAQAAPAEAAVPPGLARLEDQAATLNQWAATHLSSWLLNAVWRQLPTGEARTWARHQHKAVAAALGIGNSIAQECIDVLIGIGRVPKPAPRPQAPTTATRFAAMLVQRAQGLEVNANRLEVALGKGDVAGVEGALASLERQIAALEKARADTYHDCWGDFAASGGHDFFLEQLQRSDLLCAAVPSHAASTRQMARAATTVGDRVRATRLALHGRKPSDSEPLPVGASPSVVVASPTPH